MAQPANTLDRHDLGAGNADNVREQFADMIYNVDPTQTPFVMNSPRAAAARNTVQSWQEDEYADANPDNAAIEADDFSGGAVTAATRLRNYLQTLRKDVVVSDMAQLVRTAGRRNELSRQLVYKSVELKRDLEAVMLHPRLGAVGTSSAARKTHTVLAWIRTNLNAGVNGSSPTIVSNTVGALGAHGTGRALKMGTFLQLVTDIYLESGPVNVAYVHPFLKAGMSGFLLNSSDRRIATPYSDVGESTRRGKIMGSDAPKGINVMGAVSQYMTDFCIIDIIPDRFQDYDDGAAGQDGNGAVYLLKTDCWAISWLRKFRQVKIAKTGTSEKRIVIGDACLISRNQKASGAVVGVQDKEAVVK